MAPINGLMEPDEKQPRSADEAVSLVNAAPTLADQLFYVNHPKLRAELEKFRKEYEVRTDRPTDLTRRYVSQLDTARQQWLLDNYPEHYWQGLPSFVQAFLKAKMDAAKAWGMLDDMPAEYLQLYFRGQMIINSD